MADSPNTRTLPEIHPATVKDRRTILALVASGLAAGTLAAGAIAAKASQPDDDEAYSERYFDLCKLFGQLESDRRMWSKQLWGKHCADPDGAIQLTMIVDGPEYVRLLTMTLVGMVMGGQKTEEEILAMFSTEAQAKHSNGRNHRLRRRAPAVFVYGAGLRCTGAAILLADPGVAAPGRVGRRTPRRGFRLPRNGLKLNQCLPARSMRVAASRGVV